LTLHAQCFAVFLAAVSAIFFHFFGRTFVLLLMVHFEPVIVVFLDLLHSGLVTVHFCCSDSLFCPGILFSACCCCFC
jgi:hypothetical protein